MNSIKVINVNVGHTLSGGDTGARATTNGKLYIEEKMTRELGALVQQGLKARGIKTNLSRVDYASTLNESLNKQTMLCNQFKADLNVCIHFNCFSKESANGIEIFTYNGSKVPSAVRILENFKKLGFYNRGIKNQQLALINNTVAETIYIEACFISSPKDMALLEKYGMKKLAECIICGILGNNFNVETNSRVYRNMVVYAKGSFDIHAASILSRGLDDCILKDHTEYQKYNAKSVYSVGVLKGIPCDVVLRGKDAYETVKLVMQRLGKI